MDSSLNTILILLSLLSIYVFLNMEKKMSKNKLEKEIQQTIIKIKKVNTAIQDSEEKNKSLEKTFYEDYYNNVGHYILDSVKFTGLINDDTSLVFLLTSINTLLFLMILILTKLKTLQTNTSFFIMSSIFLMTFGIYVYSSNFFDMLS